jgi:hypothetical protein
MYPINQESGRLPGRQDQDQDQDQDQKIAAFGSSYIWSDQPSGFNNAWRKSLAAGESGTPLRDTSS